MKPGQLVWIDGTLPATIEGPGRHPGMWWVRTTEDRVQLPECCLATEQDAFMDASEEQAAA